MYGSLAPVSLSEPNANFTSSQSQRTQPLVNRRGFGRTPRRTRSSIVLSAQSSSRARLALDGYAGGRWSDIVRNRPIAISFASGGFDHAPASERARRAA